MNKQSRNSGLKPWKPGQSGNPLGRPQGARSKFSEAACADLLEDWTKNGPAVLAKVREDDPSTYLRVAFNTIPRDVNVAIEQRSGPLDGPERQSLRRLLDLIQASAATLDPDTVFAWIEEDLRARVAKQIGP